MLWNKLSSMCWYGNDYLRSMRRVPRNYRMHNFLICDRDCRKSPLDVFTLAKSRSIEPDSDRTVTLLPLNIGRHFKFDGPLSMMGPYLCARMSSARSMDIAPERSVSSPPARAKPRLFHAGFIVDGSPQPRNRVFGHLVATPVLRSSEKIACCGCSRRYSWAAIAHICTPWKRPTCRAVP